ncbi:glycerol-3-phosphate dehydrogenase/oxidase [Rubrivirga sp. S365]|uniref:Glycerol-3-phosphate dehydrogenase/oxidase n=1 Tax=Rubrivirga litoralis TaxID=3075598 RepID=A0ABU3BPR0_9BACT|nr:MULTISPECIES: glycerol-3-phosphate dehydrogenase/oxidase [unclassified Rubrivirga]MDT0631272.1 glycerol-3-phosphate dehydrogenase/oxidase [Rubrivirga sp. F394]MDT7856024.1 glycerol-3-phosphate dehydrogenase/oxidase [Rubrivirga sp. S365]
MLDRDTARRAIDEATEPWDIVVVGGGATGLGCAIDAAARGYKTLLLERDDLAKGTSSRSTKLVHGGVRYLRQGNVSLVLEALKERGTLLKNAPHLVHDLAFVVPNYAWWEGPFYGIGMKVYDLMAGRSGFGRSRRLSREETLERLPTIEPDGLDGGVVYYDGQFDDARLAVNMAQTAAEQGAAILTYCEVTGLTKDGVEVTGVVARDGETGETVTIPARVVVNATGVWTDRVRHMDDAAAPPMVQASQGVHIVLDRSFLPGDSAIMVPKTDDGRVLFAIPWRDVVVVGTTDTLVDGAAAEPRALPEELNFLLRHAARYLTRDPSPADVKSVFAGLRPLVADPSAEGGTAALSRDHVLHIADSGLVTITGGKWTTYRKMAEDTVDQAAVLAGLPERPCPTADLPIHGAGGAGGAEAGGAGDLAAYGSDAPLLQALMDDHPALGERLHPARPVRAGQVVWAARHEMARTVEDVLSRRTRELLLDARASIEMAPRVAALLAEELDRDGDWEREQVAAYTALAEGYLVPDDAGGAG